MSGRNYFNYFTEIEEYFWKKRGANLLVSPLDWAIMESWQQAGVSLEAALKGIDRAFESHARSRRGSRPMKSLAYCTDAVLEVAEQAREAAAVVMRKLMCRKRRKRFRATRCVFIFKEIARLLNKSHRRSRLCNQNWPRF
jgi:hypothetical protein